MTYRGTSNRSSYPYAFEVVLTATDSNVTGNGAVYYIGGGGGGAITILFDIGSNITNPAMRTTFTVPVKGLYCFHTTMQVGDIAVTMNQALLQIVTAGGTAQTFSSGYVNIGAVRDVNNIFSISTSALINLEVSDTVQTNLQIQGGPGDTIDILGSASTNPTTWFSGYLVC